MNPERKPRVFTDPHEARVRWIAAGIAIIVLGFIAWATIYLAGTTGRSGSFTGEVIEKVFTPAPERQITVGRGGVHAQDVEGEYLLKVRHPDGERVFHVWVDKETFDNVGVGDRFFVIPTP